MSRTVYYCAASLDGFIAAPGDDLRWLTEYDGSFDGPGAEPMEGSYDSFYEGVGSLVMGSVTYQWILKQLTEWPYAGKPTWVLTSRDLPPPEDEDADVRFAAGDLGDPAGEMLAAAGDRDLWVVGGGHVASQFADRGLLDELILTVVPVALGEGKPLFDRRLPAEPMQLLGTRAFGTGMVELRYAIERGRG